MMKSCSSAATAFLATLLILSNISKAASFTTTSSTLSLYNIQTKCKSQTLSHFIPSSKGIHLQMSSSSSSSVQSSSKLATEDELYDYASKTGTKISLNTLGPGYRAVARAAHDEEIVLGYIEGFIRPGGKILHIDKMEMFRPSLLKAQNTNPKTFTKSVSAKVSLLLGILVLLHALKSNCIDAEFLAIDDEAFQHKRLVRYFKRLGFQVYRYVGDDFKDVPDRLVWGGCGTLMGGDIKTLATSWSNTLFRPER